VVCPARISKELSGNWKTSFALPTSSLHLGWENRHEMRDLQSRFPGESCAVSLFPPRQKRVCSQGTACQETEHLMGPLGKLLHVSPLLGDITSVQLLLRKPNRKEARYLF